MLSTWRLNPCLNFARKLLQLCVCPCQSAWNKGAHHKIGLHGQHAQCAANRGAHASPSNLNSFKLFNLTFQNLALSHTSGIAKKHTSGIAFASHTSGIAFAQDSIWFTLLVVPMPYFYSETNKCLSDWTKLWALLWSVLSSRELHQNLISHEKKICSHEPKVQSIKTLLNLVLCQSLSCKSGSTFPLFR